jgi:hypothetical protein
MLGLPLHATWKILIAAVAGCLSSIYLWVYLLYRFGLEAHERGAELPTSKATLVAAIPAGFALVYIGYVLLRHLPVVRAAVRDRVRDLLARASADFESRQDESALQLYRQALRTAMGAFQQKQEGELLRLGLIAYRGVAVSALVTGRHGEAAIAIETGLATATVGLRHWPDAPPLLEEQSQLSALKEKTGLSGAVYIPEDFSEWVADDVRAD